ncbi:MAG: hypothetical protein WKF83_15490 [Nocardioidaceae bacterium]
MEKQVRSTWRSTVDDPETARKLIPDYRFGCKRVLKSNTYIETYNRDNVDLIDTGIAEITASGVVDSGRRSAQGRRHHLRHRIPRHRRDRASELHRPGGARSGQGVHREGCRDLPRYQRQRLPQPVLPARAQHRARPQLGGVHDRAAGEIRRALPG